MIIAGYGLFDPMAPLEDYPSEHATDVYAGQLERLKAGLQLIADLQPADSIRAIDMARRLLLGLPAVPDDDGRPAP